MRLVSNAKLVEFDGPADITAETTEAIVNAANSSLIGGGGVDGAIHRAAGPTVLEECQRYVAQEGRLPPGKAMITRGGQLAAKYVIHTVGPIYRGGGEQESDVLASCYREVIRLAEEHKIRSLSFPSISTGAFGYPLAEAAMVAVNAVIDAMAQAKFVERVRFVLFDDRSFKAYLRAARTAASHRTQYRIEPSPADVDGRA
jgi:O-acetyl-ADP-ribose deacetylase